MKARIHTVVNGKITRTTEWMKKNQADGWCDFLLGGDNEEVGYFVEYEGTTMEQIQEIIDKYKLPN